jgi:osmoprotectant transport system permease protein
VNIDWGWPADNLDTVRSSLAEHVQLTVIAVGIGLIISVPLAIYCYRHMRAYTPVTLITGILYTIPSLALLAFLIPYTGLSVTTAEIALVSYTLLILIRNIVEGLQGVPADAKEAALGMGYSRRQLLFRVELPLALPVIVAGIRIAAVTTIGLVTITALIGQGGFGAIILRGLRGLRSTEAFWGAVFSIGLAVIVDAALVITERLVTPWSRRRTGH